MTKSHYIMPPSNRSVDDHRNSLLQNWDRAKLVIDHLRSHGLKVTTTYDSYGRKQILSTIKPIPQCHNLVTTGLTMKWKFIAIDIGVNYNRRLLEQLQYKQKIERAGGFYFFVSSLTKFYLKFDSIFGKANHD